MERTLNTFLWGRAPTEKGIKWISRKRLCAPKSYGGLDVREIRNFNLAMLAKQSWRLLTNANPLVSEIMKEKYYPKTDFLDARMGNNSSYMWRSLMAVMKVLKAGARRKIGNGLSTKVWNIPCLPSSENGFMTTDMRHQMSQVLVNGIMCNEGKRWDLEILNDVCNNRDMDLIKRIPILLVDMQDSWYWYFEDSGNFTVKSCYRWIQVEMDDTNQ
ncbi:putative mitochondrial protein AtMg00310 [Apium graveolens]|uniref:putative mitochondrial protein AtMg00310 n=1 Tax=Apium graveolens TaxID=4045 RepID=UPI003D7A3DCA